MPNPVSSGASPVVVPNLSGFDKSFRNLLTARVGTLVPLVCDPVIAGTRVNLKSALNVSLPPLASDTFMNVDFKVEAFFVPASSLYGGMNDFITRRRVSTYVANVPDTSHLDPISAQMNEVGMPCLDLSNSQSWLNAGSLADYLGYRNLSGSPTPYGSRIYFNPLPFLAYHRVYDHFYRNSLVSIPIFNPVSSDAQSSFNTDIGALPWMRFNDGTGYRANRTISDSTSVGQLSMALRNDGSFLNAAHNSLVSPGVSGHLLALHQRHFGPDYFTTCTPHPVRNMPNGAAVNFTVNTTTGDGNIPISAIRMANALQMFAEKNNLVDDDIHAYNRAHYGVHTTGYGESLPRYLGSGSVNVYSHGITQNSEYTAGGTNNPMASIGATYGKGVGNGTLDLISGFEAPEFGYVFVMGSMVPRAAYSEGVVRHNLELVDNGLGGPYDIPDPIFQGVGAQPVYQFELDSTVISASTNQNFLDIFGYNQRFAHYMEVQDQIHGLFRDGQTLDSFAIQRTFRAPRIGGHFLVIDPDFMDQVSAVGTDISDYGYQLDCFFDYKVSMPLMAYSVPTLENMDGHTEWQPKSGYKLR